MNRDIEKQQPVFQTETADWYADDYHQNLVNQEIDNLASLKNRGCFIVKGKSFIDYVMIDDKQNVVCSYPYPHKQHEYETKIKMFKIAQNYNNHEAKGFCG